MKFRRLGRSGLMVSELTLGTMNFGGPTDEADSALMIDRALDRGVNLLDCANAYAGGASEQIVGRALNRSGKRSEVLLTSKAFLPMSDKPNDRGNSRHNLINSCLKSLKNLQTDHIDVFFLHRTDWTIPQEETLSALDFLVNKGYIRYTACSTHPAWRTVEALHIADRKGFPQFTCEQPPYNLLDRRFENEIGPMCLEYDLGVITWSPLAQGLLAGRYTSADDLPADSRGTQKSIYAERISEAGIKLARDAMEWANKRSLSLPALSVSWILHQPAVTSVIIGPRTPEHLEELFSSLDIELSPEDLTWFDDLSPPGTYVSDHFNTAGWRPPGYSNSKF